MGRAGSVLPGLLRRPSTSRAIELTLPGENLQRRARHAGRRPRAAAAGRGSAPAHTARRTTLVSRSPGRPACCSAETSSSRQRAPHFAWAGPVVELDRRLRSDFSRWTSRVIVPGHGPLAGDDEVRGSCARTSSTSTAEAGARHAEGDDPRCRLLGRFSLERWADWGEQRAPRRQRRQRVSPSSPARPSRLNPLTALRADGRDGWPAGPAERLARLAGCPGWTRGFALTKRGPGARHLEQIAAERDRRHHELVARRGRRTARDGCRGTAQVDALEDPALGGRTSPPPSRAFSGQHQERHRSDDREVAPSRPAPGRG